MQGFKRGILGTYLKSIPKLSAEAVAITQGVPIRNHPLKKLLLCPTNSRFEPKTRKSWQDKAEHTNFQYVSIWTTVFDTVFGQRLSLFIYIFSLGSIESRIPSPKRLYASTVTNMARPGNTEIHHAISILSLPMVNIFPQLAVGGWTPMPRKLNADSTSTAPAMPNTADTSTGDMAFGRICLKIILKSLAPNALAARTNSLSFRDKNSALTSLATPIHDVTPMTIIIFHMLGSRNAMTARIKKKVGIASMMSTKRILILSTQPP